ncbi:MAG: Na(+)-translocating NADH-quinone reductase subunit A [Myxococcales bacterium]|nr:Na(+)-translocating NADH-quinone reductase subunit A [Myxococcales bacterium]
MVKHIITKGLDLPISGKPVREINQAQTITHVGLLGYDYPGMKPRMHVQIGERVLRGQKLFSDRKSEGVDFTAPAAGEVVAIHRGDKRAFQSLVIRVADNEEQVALQSKIDRAEAMDGEGLRALLAESGQWTALRSRPHDRVPSPSETCSAIFVTAIDTNPLAAEPDVVLDGQEAPFREGLRALSKLTEGPVYVCVGPNWSLSVEGLPSVQKHVFEGPHPAGLVGTHIHTLHPVHRGRAVWHVGYQDVAAIGHLLMTGEIRTERVVALGGPVVHAPCHVRTRLGASIPELTAGEVEKGNEVRLVSGSVLFGTTANDEVFGYLNRYHNQVTALAEGREREFLGWLAPGVKKYSTIRAFLSRWLPQREFAFTTTTHGSHRAMVPIGMYERVMPLDILPTFLLRSILVGDLERAEKLGCLELVEEDLALCSFVSPGKEDYGRALRNVLTEIWKEG